MEIKMKIKSTVRAVLVVSICFALLFLLAPTCFAEDKGLLPQDELRRFLDAIPDDIAAFLPEELLSGDVDGAIGSAMELSSGEYLLNVALSLVGADTGGALELFCCLAGLSLLAASFDAVCGSLASNRLSSVSGFMINAAVAVAAACSQYSRLSAVKLYFDELRVLMSAALPLMGVLYAMGGNSGGATLNNATVVLWLELIELFATSGLMPAVGILTALALAEAFLPNVGSSAISKFVAKLLGTVLGLSALLLGTALGAQSVLAAASDRLSFRTAKFVAGSVIPVVGSTVGESLKTLATSVGALRSTVGIVGIILILLLLLPTLITLLLTRMAFSAAASISDMLGVNKQARFYRDMSSVYGFLIAAAALSAIMFVFVMAILALTGTAVSS